MKGCVLWFTFINTYNFYEIVIFKEKLMTLQSYAHIYLWYL